MTNGSDSPTVSLQEERLNRGLTLREAASVINVSVAALQRAEHGMSLSPANSKAIADFYGYKVSDIWPVDSEPTSSRTVA